MEQRLTTDKLFGKKHFRRKSILYQSIAIFLICAILIGLLPATAQAATLQIKYNGKKTNYTGAQTKITLDGKSVNLYEEVSSD